jgi:SAM-dependent methyltransferase
MLCRICKSDQLEPPVVLREMMFGTREEFEYVRCASCDTLQIKDIPADMTAHYPEGSYYSFTPSKPTIKDRLRRLLKAPQKPDWARSFIAEQSVLDIGCGGGALLHTMKDWGFTRLRGYDPFLSRDLVDPVLITKARPSERFDIVMMHHSLEHVPDPLATMSEIDELLADQGRVVIRIPVRQGYAWRRYGLNWAHLDPPRHFFLWTVDGFESMAAQSGFAVVDKGFDGTLFSIAGSELYEQDIPLQSDGKSNLVISPERAAELNAQVDQANVRGDGDSAWFVLSRKSA